MFVCFVFLCRRCTWMYGELTEKEAVERVDRALDHHLADQFEILLYKKNRAIFIFNIRHELILCSINLYTMSVTMKIRITFSNELDKKFLNV